MPVRMTGMISGLDTDTLIQSMVDAQRLKNKRVEDKKTLLEWKQDRWKELNAKLYKLYTDDLNKMRLQSSYLTKAVTSSNDNLVSIDAMTNAPVGSHALIIESLASSQYVTGDVIKIDESDTATAITSNTKLKDLGISVETLINLKSGDKTNTLKVTDTTTIADFVSFAKRAGYSANFDENFKRLYISSKSSGTENAFEITATTSSSSATKSKNKILSLVGYKNLTTEEKKSVDSALATLETENEINETSKAAIDTLKELAKKEAERIVISNVDAAIRAEVTPGAREAEEDKIRSEVMSAQLEVLGVTEEELTPEQVIEIQEKQAEKIEASSGRIKAAIEDAVSQAIALEKAKEDNRYDEALAEAREVGGFIDVAISSTSVEAENYLKNSKDVSSILTEIGLGTASDMVEAKDSKFKYNGVDYTTSSNVVNINGLELTLKGTSNGEVINLNVTNNTKGIYDMVKKFVSSYNEILKEMNDLYYAESARGYDPLSDDEKEAMTESQIEKWEKKIKDSILRRDSSLGSLLDSMKNAMMTSVEVDGKRYSLSSFGIKTSTVYTEKGLLHIDGNEDDALFASFENKLMKALEEDPDTVMNVLSQISQKLYDTMNEKMKAIPNVRSALTFYNDKLMSKQKTDYDKQIAKLEAKVLAMEEKYYKQFAAMETALAKMQEQSNALAGMLGISNK